MYRNAYPNASQVRPKALFMRRFPGLSRGSGNG